MSFYRLIKPDWAKPKLDNGNPNPKFVAEIQGPNTYEGMNFTPEFIAEKNAEGYNCYFFPNHPARDVYAEGVVSLAGKHIEVFNFVFVDMDLKDKVYASKEEFIEALGKFPLKPTLVVNSGNGVHAYWQIEGLTRDEYVFAQLGLLKHFKTDESIFTVLQLMRLPGSNNTKRHGDYVKAEIVEAASSGEVYKLDQFPQEVFQNLTTDEMNRGQKHLDRLDGKFTVNTPEFVNLDEIPDTFLSFIADIKNSEAKNLWNDPKGTYGDRTLS